MSLATIAMDDLAQVSGGKWSFNAPITVGDGNQVSAGAGTKGVSFPVTVGNNNTITTARGVTAPITLGFGNKIKQE